MFALALLSSTFSLLGADPGSAAAVESAVQEVELQGTVVCLPEAMHEQHQAELPTDHEHIYGFKTTDGSYYTLLRGKYSEALFIDPALGSKSLLLKGRLFPKSHVFEPMRIRSVRDGVVYDLYYFCVICNIESVSAGPCACCQDPVELKERPLRGE